MRGPVFIAGTAPPFGQTGGEERNNKKGDHYE